MPRLIDHDIRTELIYVSATRILLQRGIHGLTLRAIAGEARISLGSLTSHYDNKRRLLHLLAQCAGDAWLDAISNRVWSSGVLAFLPVPDDDRCRQFEQSVDAARVWLSWCELARSAPELRGTVRSVWRDERELLDRATGRRLGPDALEVMLATVHGLREAVCAAHEPMSIKRAQTLLSDHVAIALAAADQPETA